MVDPYHPDAYGTVAVNYNRDVEIFRVLDAMMSRIFGVCPLQKPHRYGRGNMAGFAIYDDDAVRGSARQEILRRYFRAGVRALAEQRRLG